MNISKSFSFVFEDKQWLSKLGLGALIAMIPILNFAWTGYMVELVRNVTNNAAEPLPNWDDIGKKFSDGLVLFLASLVYALPALLFICLPLAFMIVPAILAGNGNLEDVRTVIEGAGVILFFCMLFVLVIYFLFFSVAYPAILVLYSREGTFAACFKFREILNLISRNSGPFFTAWGVSIGASIAIGFVTAFAQMILNFIPCLGQLAAWILSISVVVYLSAVTSHLFGQFGYMAYLQSQPAGGD